MERVLMASGILAVITMALIGLFKLLPFIKKFKDKGWYKPLLTVLTLILAIGLCLIYEKYFLELPLISWTCAILIVFTIAEVLFGYNGVYEGFKIKDWIKTLFAKWKELKSLTPEAKAFRAVEKVEDTLVDLCVQNKDLFNAKIVEVRKKAESQKKIGD